MFFNKTLEAEVVRKLAETFWLVPRGLPCLAQLSDAEHEQVVREHIAEYGAWLCRPYNDDGYIRATRELAPAECPRTKYEALFDERPLFGGIRDDFLILSGSDTQRVNVLRALKDIVQEQQLCSSCQRQVMNFINALRERKVIDEMSSQTSKWQHGMLMWMPFRVNSVNIIYRSRSSSWYVDYKKRTSLCTRKILLD